MDFLLYILPFCTCICLMDVQILGFSKYNIFLVFFLFVDIFVWTDELVYITYFGFFAFFAL